MLLLFSSLCSINPHTVASPIPLSHLPQHTPTLLSPPPPSHPQVCFIITDADIKEECFLEYINQLLMTGEVAGLFARDELDELLNATRPYMKGELPGGLCLLYGW